MIDQRKTVAPGNDNDRQQQADNTPSAPATMKRKKSKSMHDGIAVWCDCCSCEAEPYWVAVAEEMRIDLGSDYEDDDSPPQP